MKLPGTEVRVSSWSELNDALHSRSLVQPRPEEGNHLRSPYVFRGADVAEWSLLTSLQRVPRSANASAEIIEHSLVRSFRKYASAGAFDDKSEWYVLAVAQHNGLPTRCLDWTSSPLVAAHFACGDESKKGGDGAVWCLHAGILRHINEQIIKKAASLRSIAWVYDTRLLERSFADIAELDSSLKDGGLMLLWEPPSLDSRIASQSGLLTLMNSADGAQVDFLNDHSIQYPDLVMRIVIEAAAKPEIRDMLDQNNITERALFPGLPGLCSWLRRYYGKAW
jgi:FRG domain